MTLSHNHKAFFFAAICGFLIWFFYDLAVKNEPWDSSVVIYFFLLGITGFVAGLLFKMSAHYAYFGGYVGQLLGGMVASGVGNLFLVGVIFLIVYSLPIVPGVWLGKWVAKHQR